MTCMYKRIFCGEERKKVRVITTLLEVHMRMMPCAVPCANVSMHIAHAGVKKGKTKFTQFEIVTLSY